MTNPARNKGLAAEREIANILGDLLHCDIRRVPRPGSSEDEGDLFGLPDTVAQVAWWPQRGILRAVREKPLEAETQRLRAGATFCVTWVRLNGGVWRAVLTPEQWVTYHQETM